MQPPTPGSGRRTPSTGRGSARPRTGGPESGGGSGGARATDVVADSGHTMRALCDAFGALLLEDERQPEHNMTPVLVPLIDVLRAPRLLSTLRDLAFQIYQTCRRVPLAHLNEWNNRAAHAARR